MIALNMPSTVYRISNLGDAAQANDIPRRRFFLTLPIRPLIFPSIVKSYGLSEERATVNPSTRSGQRHNGQGTKKILDRRADKEDHSTRKAVENTPSRTLTPLLSSEGSCGQKIIRVSYE
jgi:hypothetical protein